MPRILIVDDERSFLLSAVDGLAAIAPEFSVIAAENGKIATEHLARTNVDLVITDLKMPVMDGFELLAFLSRERPQTPVLVMSAFSTPEIEERLGRQGVTGVLDKPLDLAELARRIREELAANSAGHIRGFALATFLQLVSMDRKSCTLRIRAGDEVGALFLQKGELIGAETARATGTAAALVILAWDDTEIEVERSCAKPERTIEESLNHLMFEAIRLKDEHGRRRIDAPPPGFDATTVTAPPADGAPPHFTQEKTMSLEGHIKALKEIKGFNAAAIMNFTGEVLASDAIDPTLDLALVGATFNDIFRAAHDASRSIGLEACKETVITTPKGIVVMRCSGVEAKVHFHLIAVMAADGNQALMKMQLEKLVPPVMADLG